MTKLAVAEVGARTRIGRVKFKSGGEVHLLPTREKSNKDNIIDRVIDLLEIHQDAGHGIDSFVFAVFDKEGGSTLDCRSGPLGLPRLVLADFMRSRIIAEYVMDWTAENYVKIP